MDVAEKKKLKIRGIPKIEGPIETSSHGYRHKITEKIGDRAYS